MKLKGGCPDNKIAVGLLTEGSRGINNSVDSFKFARKIDQMNEKRPEFGP